LARSVYKLEEIDRRVRLFRRGQRVLDLGASPGSWSLYAAERVGREGRVLGIDIKPPSAAAPTNVELREADIFTLTPEELGGYQSFEVVLSDMAPNTTGNRFTDQCRSHELFMQALLIAESVLVPGGSFVGKLFQGPDFDAARQRLSELFGAQRIIRPKATRSESIETFLVGQDRRT
jgi:23S rRNA (uridine2552-2'-O)-methyltransferase